METGSLKALGTWVLLLALLFVPMLLLADFPQWLFFVLSAVLLFPLAVVSLLLPKSGRKSAELSPAVRDVLPVCYVVAIVLFSSEFAVLATVLAYRYEWTLVQSVSSWVADGLALCIPAIWRLPAEMSEAGFSARIDIVRNATGVGYFFGLALAAFIVADPRSVVSKFIVLVRAQPKPSRPAPRWGEGVTYAVLFVSAVCMLLQFDFVSSVSLTDIGVFGDIRRFDTSLVYQMWAMPLMVFGGLAICIRVVLVRIGEINERIDTGR